MTDMERPKQLRNLRRWTVLTVVGGVLAIAFGLVVASNRASRYGANDELIVGSFSVGVILLTVAVIVGVGAAVLSGVYSMLASRDDERASGDS